MCFFFILVCYDADHLHVVVVLADKPIPAVLEFHAQLQILELLDHKVSDLSV